MEYKSSTTLIGSMRSAVFVPGYSRKYLEKAKYLSADILILDLEDSVPESYKENARNNIREYLDCKSFTQQIIIRVNNSYSEHFIKDIEATLHENVLGLMLTKIKNEQEILYIDKILMQFEKDNEFEKEKFKLIPLIESGSAVLNANKIAIASSRVVALAFGAQDYLTDIGGINNNSGNNLIVPRSLVVIAAKAARIEALDTPYLDIKNTEGFRNEVKQAREFGFSGKLVIHPNQINIANEIFTPSKSEIIKAKQIIKYFEEGSNNEKGVILMNGELVGPPMHKSACNLLKDANKIALINQVSPERLP